MLALAGCASPLAALTSSRQLTVGAASYALRWSDQDAAEQARVSRALQRASPGLERWGGLREPVTVNLVPTHADLEVAVRRPGFGWLRAWARYDDVVLQSPRTWSAVGASDADVDELVLHEVTHCLLFQRSATRDTWLDREIPLWFREGMATWTAGQGYRFPSLDDLSRWLLAHPELDPFGDGERLSRDAFSQVYAAAFHAFAFLVQRHGEDSVKATLAQMAGGRPFATAFGAAVGQPLEAFVKQFLDFVRLGRFRGEGQPIGGPAP